MNDFHNTSGPDLSSIRDENPTGPAIDVDYTDYRALQAHKRAVIKTAAHLLPHMPPDNWLCWGWRIDRNTGKPRKRPLFGMTSKNKESWLTLEQAVKRIGETDPHGSVLCVGVGYIICEGIVSLDIDDCIDAETGEIHPAIQAELNNLPKTFAYRTVSKTGLRMVGTDVCGWVTGGKRNCFFPSGHKIEIFAGPCTFFNTFSPDTLPGCDVPLGDLGLATFGYLNELADSSRPLKNARDGGLSPVVVPVLNVYGGFHRFCRSPKASESAVRHSAHRLIPLAAALVAGPNCKPAPSM
jgi:hypothetical protein